MSTKVLLSEIRSFQSDFLAVSVGVLNYCMHQESGFFCISSNTKPTKMPTEQQFIMYPDTISERDISRVNLMFCSCGLQLPVRCQ